MGVFDTNTDYYDASMPSVSPQFGSTYSDPAMEMATRNMLASYFGTGADDPGLIGRPIPIPLQQVAGLSPQEIQARNLAQGLGGFGQQLAEAQDLYRQGAQGFDPSTAGLFGDPRARALYEQSLGSYDPRTGQQYMDQEARQMMRGAAGDIQGAQAGIAREVGGAQRDMRMAGFGAEREAERGQGGMRGASAGIGRDVDASQRAMQQAGLAAQQEGRLGQRGILDAAKGISGQVGRAQSGAGEATQRARAETAAAGRDLRSAGRMGRGTALQGIAQLAGTGQEYDPSSASKYMDPYNRDVIEAQQAEIARLGEKQKQDARSQQIQAGAFGGSRGAIQEAEIGRNVLQQQAKTGAELRSQGFQQAQQQAQQAFEQSQGRRQQAAQLTGQLGQAGAQTGISAAGQAGQLGLSAEQLAQRGALEGGQLGMSGQMNQGQLAQQAAQMGISTQELQGRLAQQAGQMGISGGQAQGNLEQQAAQMGISVQELQGQLAQQRGMMGMQGQQGIGALAGQRAGIGQNMGSQYMQGQQLGANVFGDRMGRMQGAASGMGALTGQKFGRALDAYNQSGAAARAGGAGIAGLGQQGYNMLTGQIGTLGGLGATGRGIQQRGFDAQYKAATQQADEPYMRLQRGQQMLAGAAPFMPQYSSGFGIGQQAVGANQSPSDFANAANIAGTVASFFSDLRLKENISKVKEIEPGIGWYTWDWNDKAKEIGADGLPTEGVIAQEVKEVDPRAVMIGEDGYYRVDYSKINYEGARV